MDENNKYKKLRQKAKELLQEKSNSLSNQYQDDIEKLMEELNIHQIELEMQNEQLQQANKQLLAERKKFHDLYNSAPIAYFTLNKTGNIIQLNQSAADLLKLPIHSFYYTSLFPYIHDTSKTDFSKFIKSLFLSDESGNKEIMFVDTKGQILYTKVQALAYYDIENKQKFCRLTVTDITEQKRNEQVIQKNEQQLKYTQQIAHLGSWEYDIKNDKVNWSDELFRICGYEPQSFEPNLDTGFNIIHPDDREHVKIVIKNSIKTGESYGVNHRIIKKTGDERWIFSKGEIKTNDYDQPQILTGAFLDITELKLTEYALKERVKELNCLYAVSQITKNTNESISNILQAIIRVIPPGWQYPDITYAQIEWKDKQFKTKNFAKNNLYLSADLKTNKKKTGELIVGYTQNPVSDDRNEYVFLSEEYNLINAIAENITKLLENKESRQALEESEERYKLLSNLTFEGIVIHKKGVALLLNKSFASIFAYPEKELISQNVIRKLIHPDDVHIISENVQKHYAFPYEVRGIKKDGTIFPIEIEAHSTYYKGEEIRVAAVRDITERKKAEQALRESEEKFRAIFNNVNDAMGLHRILPGGDVSNFLEVNDIACQMFGYTKEEFMQMSPLDVVDSKTINQLPVAMQQLFSDGSISFEMLHKSRSGKAIPVEISAYIFQMGNEKYISTITRDITERKIAENRMQRSNEVLQKLNNKLKEEKEKAQHYLDIAGVLFIALDTSGKVMLSNRKASQVLGYPEEEINGMNWFEKFIPKERKSEIKQVFSQVMKGDLGDVEFIENVIITKDGDWRLIAWHNSILYGENSEIIGLLSSGEDITEQRKAETALRESEERFRSIFRFANIGIGLADQKGNLINVNSEFRKMLAYEKQELLKMNFADFTHPDDVAREYDHYIQLMNGEKDNYRIQKRYLNKYNEVLWVDLAVTARRDSDGNIDLFIGMVFDITDRTKVEMALKESEEKFRTIVENANDIIYQVAPDGIFTYISPNWVDMLGHEVDEVTGKNFAQFVHPKDVHLCADFLERVLTSGKKQSNVEYRVKHKDGQYRWHISNGSPIKDAKNNTVSYIGIARDITHRKQYEDTLNHRLNYERIIAQCSHALLQDATDAIQISLQYILDGLDISQVYIFENFYDSLDELCMKKTYNVLANHEQDTNASLGIINYKRDGFERWEQQLAKNEIIIGNIADFPDIERNFLEMQGIKSILMIPLWVSQKWYGVIGFDDVKKERKWEKEDIRLLRSISEIIGLYIENKENQKTIIKHNKELKVLNATKDKFFSIIAHDLKNPFNSIVGFADLALEKSGEFQKSKILQFMDLIRISAVSAYKLLENLLEWSRSQTGRITFTPGVNNLKEIVFEAITTAQNQAEQKQIALHVEIDPHIRIYADKNMIHTVLRNLLSNAVKFTPRQGKITINAKEDTQKAIISIADTGIGMKHEQVEKLFSIDKKESREGTDNEKGTGLGLILCKEFLERNGGEICVESQLEKGSVFSFTLPLWKEEITNKKRPPVLKEAECNAVMEQIMHQPPELTEIIETKLIPAYWRAGKSLSASEITRFGEMIQFIGKKYKIKPFCDLGNIIQDDMKAFYVSNVESYLSQFKCFIEHFEDQVISELNRRNKYQ